MFLHGGSRYSERYRLFRDSEDCAGGTGVGQVSLAGAGMLRGHLLCTVHHQHLCLLLHLLLEMNLTVTFLLIGASKLPPTCVAGEWLLSSVSTHVCCEVVATGERSHTDATLEWLLSSMDTDMTCKFIRT